MTDINVMPQTVNISLYQGDTVPILITVKDEAGATVNLTGYSAKSTIYNTNNIAVANGFTCSTPNSAGEVFIFLPDGTSNLIQTGYRYDVEIWNSIPIAELGGVSRASVTTIISGTFTVQADITEVTTSGRGQLS
jgi:hypothetical protein